MVKRSERKISASDVFVLILYIAGIIFVTSFHELWIDDSQAWLIAKCASYKELFTYIPHYEGHPPLWHLILAVFAKNGAPIDFTLKAVNTAFCVWAMALVIFRSPFPKVVRYLLPFTYYFFYQYGVLSRPYSGLMAAMFLAAITYKQRNIKPWRYIMSLVLLCLFSAYGMIMAGGLCFVWTLEIITELKNNKKLKIFWKDKRFYSLCFILMIAIILMVMIIPADDCYYAGYYLTFTDRLKQIFRYEYIVIYPYECFSGNLMTDSVMRDDILAWCFEFVCGTAMWISLFLITKKNGKCCTFFLPFGVLTLFMAFKYGWGHHVGVGTMFIVFIFWIMADQDGGIAVPEIMKKLKTKLVSPLIRKLIIVSGGLICIAPIGYSVIASVNEIKTNTGLACLADVIKDNHLEDKKIMSAWMYSYYKEDADSVIGPYMFSIIQMPSDHYEIAQNYTYVMSNALMIQPYFDKNIFMNYNVDHPEDLYMHLKYKEDTDAVFAQWREQGLPDFIIGYCPLDEIYDAETLEGVRYLPIMLIEDCSIFKYTVRTNYCRMYMREDLFDDYPQFKWIDDQTGNVFERNE